MPIISTYYGIVIRMYFKDTEQHHKPHDELYALWDIIPKDEEYFKIKGLE